MNLESHRENDSFSTSVERFAQDKFVGAVTIVHHCCAGFQTPAAGYAAPSFKRPASETLHKSRPRSSKNIAAI